MAIRSRSQRKKDAEQTLADYLADTKGGGDEDLPEPSTAMPTRVLGKITQVVTSDPTYGPHLVVQPQEYTGTPPAVSDSVASTVRCYPTPNNTVSTYAVDEFISMQIIADSHAYVAVKLG